MCLVCTGLSYSQDVFEYEFDENVTIEVLDNSEEGEIPGGKAVRGTHKNLIMVFSSSNKGKGKLSQNDEAGMMKFFQGVKDGAVNSSNGKLLQEEIINLHNQKVLKFTFTLVVNGKKNWVENYVFFYKDLVYTLQLMNTEKEFEKSSAFRKRIVDSIVLK